MSKAKKLAEQYADKILALYDEEFAKQTCPRYLKMKVHYCSCDDVEEAYLQGYQQALSDVKTEILAYIETQQGGFKELLQFIEINK